MLLLAGCLASTPRHPKNICAIFKNRPKWYWAAEKTERRWKVPVAVQMAIIHQESRFVADAKPPRQYLLGVIPWTRPSNAYGYSQALNGTWKAYKRSTRNWNADRDNFEDAVDFIGWYANEAKRRAGIELNDTYSLYLAYHEGVGGYMRQTYRRKPWLIQVSKKVAYQAVDYYQQLNLCKKYLKSKPWYRFW